MVLAGTEDDLDIVGLGVVFQLATDLVAVFVRHNDIQDHHIRMGICSLGEGLFAIVGCNDVMPGRRERFADQFKSRWTVIDDKNGPHGFLPSSLWRTCSYKYRPGR